MCEIPWSVALVCMLSRALDHVLAPVPFSAIRGMIDIATLGNRRLCASKCSVAGHKPVALAGGCWGGLQAPWWGIE